MSVKRKNARAFSLAFWTVILIFIFLFGTLTAYTRMKTADGEYMSVAEVYMVNDDYVGVSILGEDYTIDRNVTVSVPSWSTVFVPEEAKLLLLLGEYISDASDG